MHEWKLQREATIQLHFRKNTLMLRLLILQYLELTVFPDLAASAVSDF